MKKLSHYIVLGAMVLALSGCATYTGVGSETWYNARMGEIEEAHKANKMTEKEYIEAKNQVDQLRINYMNRDTHPQANFGFGWWY